VVVRHPGHRRDSHAPGAFRAPGPKYDRLPAIPTDGADRLPASLTNLLLACVVHAARTRRRAAGLRARGARADDQRCLPATGILVALLARAHSHRAQRGGAARRRGNTSRDRISRALTWD
jgi:hypothetical protein